MVLAPEIFLVSGKGRVQAFDKRDFIPHSEEISLHASDNRVEMERARHALTLAAAGQRVVIVSSGDPGIFAMASAVFEALEAGPPDWRSLDIRVLPGVTAMLAAAARSGAPLGHDFCVLNLSDNLKPWTLIERRLRLAVEADFAMAFYNPRSQARPDGFTRVLTLLKDLCTESRPVIFARAISTAMAPSISPSRMTCLTTSQC